MRKNKYLLTYTKEGSEYFKWFETERDMDQFLDDHNEVTVIEGVHLIQSETVRGFRRRDAI